MIVVQRETQAQVRLRNQINTRSTMDMFSESSVLAEVNFCEAEGVRREVEEYLLKHFINWSRFTLNEINKN